MKYSTWIIILSCINTGIIFSGLPTGTKKIIIIATTLALLSIGLILRAIEKRQEERLLLKKQAMEKMLEPDLEIVASSVAEDVYEKVEEEIESITHHESTLYDTEPDSESKL